MVNEEGKPSKIPTSIHKTLHICAVIWNYTSVCTKGASFSDSEFVSHAIFLGKATHFTAIGSSNETRWEKKAQSCILAFSTIAVRDWETTRSLERQMLWLPQVHVWLQQLYATVSLPPDSLSCLIIIMLWIYSTNLTHVKYIIISCVFR